MKEKEPRKLSKKGLRAAQKQFREWCRKPIAKEVMDLIRETTKDEVLSKKRKNDRNAKDNNCRKEVDV